MLNTRKDKFTYEYTLIAVIFLISVLSVRVEWSKQKAIGVHLAEMTVEELDKSLKQFYAEARNKEGENYSRATLLSLRNGTERFLNTPPNNLGIKFTKDPRFVLSNQMLDAKIKQLKKEGTQNTIHKPPIDEVDLAKLKTSEVFSLTKPLSFLRNVWFHVSLFWCRRGFEGQRNLNKTSFAFETDAAGSRFVTMTHDETTKNHPGEFLKWRASRRMAECTKQTLKWMVILFWNFSSQSLIQN